ncbi:hypothetical protein [Allokutzneria oryzae]|uniref:Zinc-ribbon domain-containing protein n=1 Tax=Allokutzneria oryzae TaxID=1378989 RepID=A0ABV5ZZE5_9PSEU
MGRPIIHTEVSRSWWNGSARTACGRTITRVTYVGYSWLGSSLTCPTCKALKKASK